MRQYVQLHLPCANSEEASKIAGALLEQRLIVCAKQMPVESAFWWRGAIEQANEILLMMDSVEDLFPQVEAAVSELHSYEVYVLQQLPLVGLSVDAQSWMDENLKPYEAGI